MVGSFTLLSFVMLANTFVGAASPTLLEAKKEAEARRYIFFTSHDEIVAMAKREGRLSVSSGLAPANFKPLINAFKQRYPFITDIHVEEIAGADSYQRFLLEIKSGQAQGWDTIFIPIDLGKEYMPY